MMQQLQPVPAASVLDVGCGTGHFSRRFAAAGLSVTGIDPDGEAIAFARSQGNVIDYLEGTALDLPFGDGSFDYCSAVTSLCFVPELRRAVIEMWRVSRKAIILGLLNRHSLLYLKRKGQGGYRGARWDTISEIHPIVQSLMPASVVIGSAIILPGGGPCAQLVEALHPAWLPGGAFLSVCVRKQ